MNDSVHFIPVYFKTVAVDKTTLVHPMDVEVKSENKGRIFDE
jgi:hypothetical protein